MEKQLVIDRVKDILVKIFPEFEKDICSEETLQKKCFHIGTLKNFDKLGGENHLCFCMFFKDDKNFIPSIFCRMGSTEGDDFLSEPGEVINVNNLENGILEFISKPDFKKFLSEHSVNVELAAT